MREWSVELDTPHTVHSKTRLYELTADLVKALSDHAAVASPGRRTLSVRLNIVTAGPTDAIGAAWQRRAGASAEGTDPADLCWDQRGSRDPGGHPPARPPASPDGEFSQAPGQPRRRSHLEPSCHRAIRRALDAPARAPATHRSDGHLSVGQSDPPDPPHPPASREESRQARQDSLATARFSALRGCRSPLPGVPRPCGPPGGGGVRQSSPKYGRVWIDMDREGSQT